MFAFKNYTRGTTRILSIGMIITLSLTLVNAHICYNAYQTQEGGWFPGDGSATCGDGTRTYQCSLPACTPGPPNDLFRKLTCVLPDLRVLAHQIYQRCSKVPTKLPGNMNFRVLSYTLEKNVLVSRCIKSTQNSFRMIPGIVVTTGPPGQTYKVYCPNDVENKVKITVCPDADCDKGV
ncbi:hypothetical protein MJO28_000774 [Puccinia striiformis f. sp. tritici]|uniref:Uncharacterized protein n=2 Tax=Puccinia striiformis TaxID=27350 RepID=A0A2S4WB23_9BASI|nr:hypothetical protein MJO28_000774 [Puccinia striiformis f. sp. tritici]POW18963.1 hypothetical protein PSHT_05251 [Puccinia striiformis]